LDAKAICTDMQFIAGIKLEKNRRLGRERRKKRKVDSRNVGGKGWKGKGLSLEDWTATCWKIRASQDSKNTAEEKSAK